MAVFLGCTSTDWLGLYFLWFYVQELPKAQPAVVLVLKRLRRLDSGSKSHPTDWFCHVMAHLMSVRTLQAQMIITIMTTGYTKVRSNLVNSNTTDFVSKCQ